MISIYLAKRQSAQKNRPTGRGEVLILIILYWILLRSFCCFGFVLKKALKAILSRLSTCRCKWSEKIKGPFCGPCLLTLYWSFSSLFIRLLNDAKAFLTKFSISPIVVSCFSRCSYFMFTFKMLEEFTW